MAQEQAKPAQPTKTIQVALGPAGHQEIKAIEVPLGELEPWTSTVELSQVGKSIPRLDGRAKVTGAARYTHDINLPNMLHARMLRSPHPAATIESIDTAAARALPGVRAVITTESKEVRFAGQDIAAVAADSPDLAEDAVRLIRVRYRTKPFVVDLERAMRDDAPRVFADPSKIEDEASEGDLEREESKVQLRGNVRGPNVVSGAGIRGDVAAGLAAADVTLERTYKTQVQTHACLETHGIVAQWEGDQLTVWASTQGTFSVRAGLAEALEIPESKVRVITHFMGGGFGSKFGPSAVGSQFGIWAAKLAKQAGRPVKLMLDRSEEHLCTGNRPNSIQQYRAGINRDGKLTALELKVHGSAGIGGGAGAAGPVRGMYHACPNVYAEESDVFTNAGPGTAMRAPGHPQGMFGLESLIDELAQEIGMDPLALRKLNDTHPVRLRQYDIGAEAIGWQRRHATPGAGAGPKKRGLGMAGAVWYVFGGPPTQVLVEAHRDGTVELRCGVQDIGTGIRTVLGQIAAEELGLETQAIEVKIGDTNFPVGPASGGSVTTYTVASAARSAASKVKDALLELAAAALDAPASELKAGGGRIFVAADPSRGLSFQKVAERMESGSISAMGDRLPSWELYQRLISGVQFAEVEVDVETGVVRVIKVVAVHDCGLPMNRLQIESQIYGGVIQGMSFALHEDRVMDRNLGVMLNPNLESYKISMAPDMPEIVPIITEVSPGGTNAGPIGIGEPVVVPTAGAIANAIYNATGARMRELPITPAKLLAALREQPA